MPPPIKKFEVLIRGIFPCAPFGVTPLELKKSAYFILKSFNYPILIFCLIYLNDCCYILFEF